MTIQPPRFQRTKENFTCAHCGAEVVGNGYTNHCPKCLWSRHVDVNPGDRASECGDLMEPIRAEKKGDEYILTHRCVACGFERRQRTVKEDDFDAIIKVFTQSSRL